MARLSKEEEQELLLNRHRKPTLSGDSIKHDSNQTQQITLKTIEALTLIVDSHSNSHYSTSDDVSIDYRLKIPNHKHCTGSCDHSSWDSTSVDVNFFSNQVLYCTTYWSIILQFFTMKEVISKVNLISKYHYTSFQTPEFHMPMRRIFFYTTRESPLLRRVLRISGAVDVSPYKMVYYLYNDWRQFLFGYLKDRFEILMQLGLPPQHQHVGRSEIAIETSKPASENSDGKGKNNANRNNNNNNNVNHNLDGLSDVEMIRDRFSPVVTLIETIHNEKDVFWIILLIRMHQSSLLIHWLTVMSEREQIPLQNLGIYFDTESSQNMFIDRTKNNFKSRKSHNLLFFMIRETILVYESGLDNANTISSHNVNHMTENLSLQSGTDNINMDTMDTDMETLYISQEFPAKIRLEFINKMIQWLQSIKYETSSDDVHKMLTWCMMLRNYIPMVPVMKYCLTENIDSPSLMISLFLIGMKQAMIAARAIAERNSRGQTQQTTDTFDHEHDHDEPRATRINHIPTVHEFENDNDNDHGNNHDNDNGNDNGNGNDQTHENINVHMDENFRYEQLQTNNEPVHVENDFDQESQNLETDHDQETVHVDQLLTQNDAQTAPNTTATGTTNFNLNSENEENNDSTENNEDNEQSESQIEEKKEDVNGQPVSAPTTDIVNTESTHVHGQSIETDHDTANASIITELVLRTELSQQRWKSKGKNGTHFITPIEMVINLDHHGVFKFLRQIMQTTNCNLEQLQGMSQFLTFPPMTQQLLNQRLFYHEKENQGKDLSKVETHGTDETIQSVQTLTTSDSTQQ